MQHLIASSASFTQLLGRCAMLGAAAIVLAPSPVSADTIKLSTGETLEVEVLDMTEDTLRINHPVLGEMTLARSAATILPPPEADAPPPAPPAEEPPVEEEGDWKLKFTLGGALTSGNTDTSNLAAQFTAVRETTRNKTAFDTGYFFAQSNGDRSESRYTAGLRHDWLNPGSKWFYFADARYDFDEFQSWDHRLGAHVGVGYKLIEPPKWKINLLGGIGAIKEWGSENEDVRPEALFGVEGEWTISEKQSLVFSSIVYPDLSELGEFRWVNSAAWQCLIDEKNKLSLKAGLLHEHQSQVDPGREKDDLRVFAGLELEF